MTVLVERREYEIDILRRIQAVAPTESLTSISFSFSSINELTSQRIECFACPEPDRFLPRPSSPEVRRPLDRQGRCRNADGFSTHPSADKNKSSQVSGLRAFLAVSVRGLCPLPGVGALVRLHLPWYTSERLPGVEDIARGRAMHE